MIVVTASAITVTLLLATTVFVAHPAFALQHFFNCITDISNKDGGDHNLTAQQVLDCFKKEFPSNDQSISSSSATIGHIHSQILR